MHESSKAAIQPYSPSQIARASSTHNIIRISFARPFPIFTVAPAVLVVELSIHPPPSSTSEKA